MSQITNLQEEIFQAIGEASLCWEPKPTGVFDSTSAIRIGDSVAKKIQANPHWLFGNIESVNIFEEWRTERTRAISEMFDKPDNCGIYPTGAFFDRIDFCFTASMRQVSALQSEVSARQKDSEISEWREVRDVLETENFGLQKENESLKEAARELIHLHICEMEGIGSGQPTRQQWLDAVEKLSELVNKK
jgi:hypothetical protein